jgi:hypothetical protein
VYHNHFLEADTKKKKPQPRVQRDLKKKTLTKQNSLLRHSIKVKSNASPNLKELKDTAQRRGRSSCSLLLSQETQCTAHSGRETFSLAAKPWDM